MEIGLIIAVIAVVWFMWGTLANIGNAAESELNVLIAQRKADHIDTMSRINIDDEKVTAAKANMARLKSIDI